ncbi:MAG: LOG family protein [Phycisphaeraceae bacterium]|nr:MAG: LOG family protein [Phycisphaeraceae bacterium]
MTKEHHRQELDPPERLDPADESAAPPERALQKRAEFPDVQGEIDALVSRCAGAEPDAFHAKLVRELITAALKLIPDGRDSGELKLMTAAMKELRYAYRVFGAYSQPHKVTIFGSARTPEDHPDYLSAVEFSRRMAEAGWMSITGAGDGIMKAGHVGPGRKASFGVAIRLPFETTANEVIVDDEKLIHFKYFFTRKLIFLSQAEAVVCFPGGFGTMDEAFETLTLVQTGKASMIPIVMVEGQGPTAGYWAGFRRFIEQELLTRGWVSPEDPGLFYNAESADDAANHVLQFYRNYHSSRYVRDDMVIRVQHRLTDEAIERLNDEFAVLVKSGRIHQRGAFDEETDHRRLPRIVFAHTRHKFGLIRRLIERINALPTAD